MELYPARRVRLAPAAAAATAVAPVEASGGAARVDGLPLAPGLRRAAMLPHSWGVLNPLWRRGKACAQEAQERDTVDGSDPLGQWQHPGNLRRLSLLFMMLAQTALATQAMARVLPYQGQPPLEIAALVLFALLFCWVSAGFWTALAGFLVLWRGGDRFAVSREAAREGPLDAAARTAIVMPICNEDVARVAAGLRATHESIRQTGELACFDFFILSDSNDANACAAELVAWERLCRELDGFGRIFYRRRRRRVKRKSGNIDDFCRRWGSAYRYMIVLDADSIMRGDCVSALVRLMEAHPGAGIIQTAPRAVGRETLYARIQQFAGAVYGPLFTAGLHYWQLGESHYWGHNAIIRLAPFMAHCALAPLPGRGGLSGEILSHDFVEAALMRRAGWAVWIAYDLDGSYEELPPNLLDELKRDRRWCHGNLMNFRLLAARGMHAVHRAVFVTGAMAYLSAPLWFAFLLLSTVLLAQHTLVEPAYFTEPRQLFPTWPQWHPGRALALFSATATLLFLPKLLAALLVCKNGAQTFGGRLRVVISMLLEWLFSMLLAPVRMLFHTRFVLAALLGWRQGWKSPPRQDAQTGWAEALRQHGWQALLGLGWGGLVGWLSPAFLPWLLPIAGALVLAPLLSVWSSRVAPGRSARAARLFLIPEEVAPPAELAAAFADADAGAAGDGGSHALPGFVDAVRDPVINALACAAVRPHPVLPAATRAARMRLLARALDAGPDALCNDDRLALLGDPLLLARLHRELRSELRTWPAWAIYRASPGGE
ncbi:glucans biosynthesis glucosyltransferase MdoH [Noviherbaspirillum sedimenti]|uniref:Glucans biosynthesis glucosyltransferase H n=1 Tax=Noviherbaspirillum sedimenti TaxID=2320865 RepID=A0A3A3G279_9BURK|nr:glucans biosynthesis glucosyltransferase MdoH [Noviherbaspirillum sedimenti]RJG01974.1 glucans biosynthesis glucosyltransferase MdoH [Noviherbaspirillum sedimenti]